MTQRTSATACGRLAARITKARRGTRADGAVRMEALKTCEPCARKDHKTTKTSKKNCGANCLCVYGLGEQIGKGPGGSRANPVWGEVKGLLEVLGDNPNDNVRGEEPAGLRNLGATCYLGSLVQVLYHNAAFRDALYRTPSTQNGSEETVVSALQKIFADLEVGERSSCDVNVLTDLLGLEVSVQQDPQEFGKLFMAKVEECVGDDTFVADVFRGQQTYETTCSECHNVTERAADFDELEVALRGQSSVGDCVRCHFNPESLEGDNQYHCERCGKKVDAERRLKIVKAPPVLQVQLLRYVYDRVTWEKKKLRDAIETTASIKIDENGTSVDYDLCALVLHRGESAHGAESAWKMNLNLTRFAAMASSPRESTRLVSERRQFRDGVRATQAATTSRAARTGGPASGTSSTTTASRRSPRPTSSWATRRRSRRSRASPTCSPTCGGGGSRRARARRRSPRRRSGEGARARRRRGSRQPYQRRRPKAPRATSRTSTRSTPWRRPTGPRARRRSRKV